MSYANSEYRDASFGALFDFSFRRFVTLGIVKLLYILLIVLAGLTWLGVVIAGFSQGALSGLLSMVFATILVLVQIIVWRVLLEIVVVIFRIAENTTRLVDIQTPAHLQSSTGGFPVTPVYPAAPSHQGTPPLPPQH